MTVRVKLYLIPITQITSSHIIIMRSDSLAVRLTGTEKLSAMNITVWERRIKSQALSRKA